MLIGRQVVALNPGSVAMCQNGRLLTIRQGVFGTNLRRFGLFLTTLLRYITGREVERKMAAQACLKIGQE